MSKIEALRKPQKSCGSHGDRLSKRIGYRIAHRHRFICCTMPHPQCGFHKPESPPTTNAGDLLRDLLGLKSVAWFAPFFLQSYFGLLNAHRRFQLEKSLIFQKKNSKCPMHIAHWAEKKLTKKTDFRFKDTRFHLARLLVSKLQNPNSESPANRMMNKALSNREPLYRSLMHRNLSGSWATAFELTKSRVSLKNFKKKTKLLW